MDTLHVTTWPWHHSQRAKAFVVGSVHRKTTQRLCASKTMDQWLDLKLRCLDTWAVFFPLIWMHLNWGQGPSASQSYWSWEQSCTSPRVDTVGRWGRRVFSGPGMQRTRVAEASLMRKRNPKRHLGMWRMWSENSAKIPLSELSELSSSLVFLCSCLDWIDLKPRVEEETLVSCRLYLHRPFCITDRILSVSSVALVVSFILFLLKPLPSVVVCLSLCFPCFIQSAFPRSCSGKPHTTIVIDQFKDHDHSFEFCDVNFFKVSCCSFATF